MALRLKIELAVAALLLALAGLGFHAWIEHVKADAKMTATVGALQDVIGKVQEQRDSLASQMVERAAEYDRQQRQLDKLFQAAATPEQVAKLVSERLVLPTPIEVVTPQPTAETPHPKSEARIPEIDFPQIKAYVNECETCKLERSVLQADAEDRIKEMALAQQQIDALAKQRDSAIEANKGGSFLQRLGRNAKWLLIGAVGGAIATRAAH